MIRPRLKTVLLLLALVVIGGALCVGKIAYDFGERLRAEYGAAGVIRDVTRYVEAHEGAWPQSWNDIPNGDWAQKYVRMKFDVDTNALVDDPTLIQSTIVPVTGEYHTYPHAERQLNELRDLLKRFRDGMEKGEGFRRGAGDAEEGSGFLSADFADGRR